MTLKAGGIWWALGTPGIKGHAETFSSLFSLSAGRVLLRPSAKKYFPDEKLKEC